ncbi:MAG: ATP-dependent helicase, partial [Candidatus Aminicenantes bacterium]|nr:ATP-dependent helicase [Candidatus Aminicenantes bacterium]
MLDLLSGLNKEQAQAVAHGDGPLLIIAGAGTGKTKVITNRIASLITEKQALPDEILAVTFTEKAANEMEERVDCLIPYSYSFVAISTFNSFGEQVLRDYGLDIGLAPDFRLLDEVEQAIFFREHLFKMPLRYYRPLSSPTRYIMEILSAVKRLKQEDISPEEYAAFARSAVASAGSEADEERARKFHEMAQVFEAYQKLLRRENKIDFEDQLSLAADLFRRHPSVLEFYQKKFKYILVDEFQDTNTVQFELLQMLASGHRNLTVVGDDDQSIFRFRGASLSNILHFSRVYPDAKKIVLTRNYRSTQQILDASHCLIRFNNPDRLEVRENISKTLTAQRKSEGRSIQMHQFDTLSHEADYIAGVIADSVESGGLRYSDAAVLVRRNGDAEPFLQALNIREIPFRFSGSRGLYGQPEIRLLLSFIRSVTDFDDSRSLFYLASSDIYAVPPYDLTVLFTSARKKNVSLHRIFKAVAEGTETPEISGETLEKVKAVMKDLAESIELAKEKNAGQVLYAFLERSCYLKQLIARQDAE